jgi:hypothetical protein
MGTQLNTNDDNGGSSFKLKEHGISGTAKSREQGIIHVYFLKTNLGTLKLFNGF